MLFFTVIEWLLIYLYQLKINDHIIYKLYGVKYTSKAPGTNKLDASFLIQFDGNGFKIVPANRIKISFLSLSQSSCELFV